MKIILIIIFLFFSSPFFSQEKNVDISKLEKKILKKFNIKKDKLKSIIFIKPHKIRFNPKYYIYISIKNKQATLRIVTKYHGNKWIFMNKAILIINNKKYDYTLKNITKKVKSGNVYERSDMVINNNLLNVLNKIKIKDKVELKMKGKRESTIKLNKQIKKNIIDILFFYDKILKTSNE